MPLENAMCYERRAVPAIYTARVRVRHHEVDAWGRAHPAVYLRLLAQAAIEASSAAGFDGHWYVREGVGWLIRRSTFEIQRPARAGEPLDVRTWVEDFRRVRSYRRYELYDRAGTPSASALTDWVFVDLATGKPRRIPAEMACGFGVDASVPGPERPVWTAPPPPADVPRPVHRVRFVELDSLGHLNNAAWLDVLAQATLDVLADRRWPLARLLVDGAAPRVVRGDVEYLDAALYGNRLELPTWFAPAGDGLDVHQQVLRNDGRLLVQATTHWRWADLASGAGAPVPEGLLAALAPARAA